MFSRRGSSSASTPAPTAPTSATSPPSPPKQPAAAQDSGRSDLTFLVEKYGGIEGTEVQDEAGGFPGKDDWGLPPQGEKDIVFKLESLLIRAKQERNQWSDGMVCASNLDTAILNLEGRLAFVKLTLPHDVDLAVNEGMWAWRANIKMYQEAIEWARTERLFGQEQEPGTIKGKERATELYMPTEEEKELAADKLAALMDRLVVVKNKLGEDMLTGSKNPTTVVHVHGLKEWVSKCMVATENAQTRGNATFQAREYAKVAESANVCIETVEELHAQAISARNTIQSGIGVIDRLLHAITVAGKLRDNTLKDSLLKVKKMAEENDPTVELAALIRSVMEVIGPAMDLISTKRDLGESGSARTMEEATKSAMEKYFKARFGASVEQMGDATAQQEGELLSLNVNAHCREAEAFAEGLRNIKEVVKATKEEIDNSSARIIDRLDEITEAQEDLVLLHEYC